MDRSTSFGRIIRFLDDVEVIRYDRRGYGKSLDLGVGTLDDHVDDLLAVIGERPAVVVGHSIGGVIGLAPPTAVPSSCRRSPPSRRRCLGGLVAHRIGGGSVALRPRDDHDAEVEQVAAERFMRRMVGEHIWDRLPPWTRAARRAEGGALLADLRSLRPTAALRGVGAHPPVT